MVETIPGILPGQGLPKLAHAADKRKLTISRRRLVLGLGGLAVLGAAGGAINWLLETHRHIQSSGAPSTTPGLSPNASPVSLGTTFHTYLGHHYIVYCVAWSPDHAFM